MKGAAVSRLGKRMTNVKKTITMTKPALQRAVAKPVCLQSESPSHQMVAG